MATIGDVCSKFQMYVATVSGIRQTDATPPEDLVPGLASVCYPFQGGWMPLSEEDRLWLHQVILEISVPRVDLPRDVAALVPYIESVPTAIWNAYTTDGCNGLVEWIESFAYTLQPELYAGEQRLMLRFTFRNVRLMAN